MSFDIKDFSTGAATSIKATSEPTGTDTTQKVPHHNIDHVSDGDYVACSASGTTTCSGGGGGAAGDYLHGVLIVPGTTGAGNVQIKDGGGSAITIFTGGGTLADLRSWFVPLWAKSASGAWQIVTGSNVSAIAVGNFT